MHFLRSSCIYPSKSQDWSVAVSSELPCSLKISWTIRGYIETNPDGIDTLTTDTDLTFHRRGSPRLSGIVTFLTAMTKYLIENKFMKEGCIWLTVWSFSPWCQGKQGSGGYRVRVTLCPRSGSTEMNITAYLIFSASFSLNSSSMGWCHPHSGWLSFHSLEIPSQTCPVLCLLGDGGGWRLSWQWTLTIHPPPFCLNSDQAVSSVYGEMWLPITDSF